MCVTSFPQNLAIIIKMLKIRPVRFINTYFRISRSYFNAWGWGLPSLCYCLVFPKLLNLQRGPCLALTKEIHQGANQASVLFVFPQGDLGEGHLEGEDTWGRRLRLLLALDACALSSRVWRTPRPSV